MDGDFFALVMAQFEGDGGCSLTAKTFANAQVTPALQVPMGYVYLVVPLAGVLLVFFSLVAVVDELKREG